MAENTKETYTMSYKGYSDIEVTVDDMPNSLFKDIALLCGVDVAVKLLSNFPGVTIQVPIYGFEKIQKKIILSEYNNDPYALKTLARKLRLSEYHIRDVLKRYKIVPSENGQTKLFDNETMKMLNGTSNKEKE